MTSNQKVGYALLAVGAVCCVSVIGAPIGVLFLVAGGVLMFSKD